MNKDVVVPIVTSLITLLGMLASLWVKDFFAQRRATHQHKVAEREKQRAYISELMRERDEWREKYFDLKEQHVTLVKRSRHA